ncbi:unannotated protein [freshwater metagenome]|jgi:uncharacterized membrane protein|uniref:Unannotated protein n=1 Tax=freshwater metagenome TaxID=449393 RepID=A0A6J7RQL2_9ZZZZ|nr:DUF1211 domain-containing protein [Actinomycetota bacterium]MSV94435.1 DUF1211 domain-containing protein [Actinomycetota bacterium]MSW61007.1 DUF1211 domain-containing protein [Actinomycetota bacterium]MSY44531.1 DUF1211 domain-containing protein [Actinomycetota bacterium]
MTDSAGSETSRRDIDRLVAFSDGIFAIAMTLLVLSISIPELNNNASNLNQQLWQAIKDQYPEMFAYFLSFVVIGRYWLIHHRVFRLIHRVDPGLFSLNLALLSLIAFMPYSTEIYGRYQSTTSALVIYALTVSLVGIVQIFLFEHINNKKLLDPKVRPDFLVMARPRSYTIPAIFLISIPVAFFTEQAWIIWIVGLILARFIFNNPLASFDDPYRTPDSKKSRKKATSPTKGRSRPKK